jgi:hypothetical protein
MRQAASALPDSSLGIPKVSKREGNGSIAKFLRGRKPVCEGLDPHGNDLGRTKPEFRAALHAISMA